MLNIIGDQDEQVIGDRGKAPEKNHQPALITGPVRPPYGNCLVNHLVT